MCSVHSYALKREKIILITAKFVCNEFNFSVEKVAVTKTYVYYENSTVHSEPNTVTVCHKTLNNETVQR